MKTALATQAKVMIFMEKLCYFKPKKDLILMGTF
jgi:hypothetical protein